MKEPIVTYDMARKLKELGFDWESRDYYYRFKNDDPELWHSFEYANHNGYENQSIVRYSAPTLSLSQRWLRENKGIAINIIAHDGGSYHWEEIYLPIFREREERWPYKSALNRSPSYDEALSDGLETIITLLMNKDK